MKKGFVPVIVIVSLTVLTLVGIGIALNFQAKSKNNEPKTDSFTSPSSTAEPTQIDQSSAQPATKIVKRDVYTNQNLKYSFEYPSSWKLFRDSAPWSNNGCDICRDLLTFTAGSTPLSDSDIVEVTVYEDERIKTPDDYFKVNDHINLADFDWIYTKVAEQPSITYRPKKSIPEGIRNSRSTYYLIVKNSFYYSIVLVDSPEVNKNRENYQKDFDQMLSTFKFE